MSETQFAMVSDWMANGNVNEFVKAHPDTNRLELVGFSLSLRFGLQLIGDRITHPAGRRRQGVDLHPRSGDDSRRPQGGTFSITRVTVLSC